MSRIGKKPVELPSGVTASVSGQTVEVKGPQGTHSFKATDDVTISVEGNVITVEPRGKSKRARQQWGMSRTMVANLAVGVSEGFKKELELSGVGYRAQMQGNVLKLALGYSARGCHSDVCKAHRNSCGRYRRATCWSGRGKYPRLA
jgi:large subunit ribosomal protein L6